MGISKSSYKLTFWMLLVVVVAETYYVEGVGKARCMHIFGDSLSDAGNNNNLPTILKFNYLPYGIDFPTGVTGRATNGLTGPDFISQLLNLGFIPPYYRNTGRLDILKGVNYASGGAGILDETGIAFGFSLSLRKQIENHASTFGRISRSFGGDKAAKQYLSRCFYYANIGSNDYLNNYFLPNSASSRLNLTKFTDLLISKYSLRLRELHKLGARKFALASLGRIGCAPGAIARANSSANGCVEVMNTAASIFNKKLRVMVDEMNFEFSADSKFIVINTTSILANNPAIRGIKNRNATCCRTVRSTGQCVANGTPCQNRNDYVYFDGYNPTEPVNKIFALSAYNSSNPDYTYPTNIYSLF